MAADDTILLWSLHGRGRDVRCLRRRTTSGLDLRILWGDELFLTESFRDPKCLAKRADEFRATLESRGWTAIDDASSEAAGPSGPQDGAVAPGPGYQPTPDAARDGAAQPRVLLVDDDVEVRTFMRRCLDDARYLVTEAADVDGALNALDRQPVDAVVLDVRLPDPMGWGRTGLEVLAFIRLHAASSPLPVLLLTGHPLEPEEQELVRRHRADVFMKPDGYGMLLQRLDHLTRGHSAGG